MAFKVWCKTNELATAAQIKKMSWNWQQQRQVQKQWENVNRDMVPFSIHETTGFAIRTMDMHAYPKKGTYNLLLNTLTWKNRVNIFLHVQYEVMKWFIVLYGYL